MGEGGGMDGRSTLRTGDRSGGCHYFQAAADENQSQEGGSWVREEGINLRLL